MMSRLQADSWSSNIKQDFRLKPSKGSWLDLCWQPYRKSQGLSSKTLSTFTASSFACHDLLLWPYKKSLKVVKPRYNSSSRVNKRSGKPRSANRK
jgi:hypothetical protein